MATGCSEQHSQPGRELVGLISATYLAVAEADIWKLMSATYPVAHRQTINLRDLEEKLRSAAKVAVSQALTVGTGEDLIKAVEREQVFTYAPDSCSTANPLTCIGRCW